MGEVLKVHPHCLVICVDETGHEDFADRKRPIFGYAGCMVMAANAQTVLTSPWRAMKECHFGGADVPLHASDLEDLTTDQLEALGNFFRSQPFGRFGVTMTVETVLPETHSTMTTMPKVLGNRWGEIASRFHPPPVQVAVLFESSHRLDPLVERHFSPVVVHVGGVRVPVHHGFIEKRHRVEELEVADFIAQAAGGQAMRQLRGHTGFRKDFEAVFHANALWSSFMFVSRVEIEPGS